MIDLSFLTEAEQEAILRVLNRDAELKKAEEERVRHLYDAVDDENELKYKSGQWFYEAKSKRHRDKIHGADLVRASMRKRKAPPATLAELSRNYKENSKKTWVSSVNKDVFIPPELYGVMEDQEEEQGGFVPVKIEPTQSSKRVSFLSTDKNMESSKNGNVSPSRQRRNPFNSTNEGDDDTELGKDTHEPVNGPESGDKVSYPDVLPPKIKFGVKLPYPAPGEIIRLSSTSPNASLTNGGQIPIPKPRTMPLKKTDSLERSSSDLKREDSFGSSGRPKSILKRRSSSSSTDSESIRLAQKADLNKIGLSTPILQAEPVDESPDKLKQVRFSANVHQNPPSPGGESVGGKEIGEFGILEPGLSQASLENRASSEDSVSAPKPSSSLVLDILTKTIYRKGSGEIPDLNGSPVEGPSLGANSGSLNEDLNNIKEDSFVQENKPEVSLALEANVSSDNDPLYAAVKKPSGSFSSGLSQDKKPESESPDASKRNSIDPKQGIEESDPILRALKRSSTKTLPPLPVQEISLEKSNQDDITVPKEDRDHTYEEVRADKVVPERSHFSDPEKLKRLSQSVPSFLNDDTDGRETDSASESSFQLGRHKKSPSSLTNLSGSSGMASLSSVSGSVMSIYSGDFGNVDIKGNIQFALDYADNLQEFQVFVSQCKDLAAADVKKQRSDPYVKAYLLPEKAKMGKRKTGVKKKTLNPVYNDVLRYKINKNALLSQTLNLSVWHHDVLGRNSFLGEVDVNLASWDWSNKQMNWYPLQPRTPAAGIGLENRGEMKLALKYVPEAFTGAKNAGTGEVHIWLKECTNLPMLRGNKINSFIKCTILPDTSRKSRQKTRAVDKTPNPYFNHTMVYDGFRKEDLKEACVELTVWDHNKLTNHFLGGLRIGLGTGKSYGTPVDWMDSNAAEATTWEKMITSPDTWVEAILPLRMLKMAKMAK
uniref:Synaptotagmin-like protein 2 n=1 Tax=Xenopus tropicalis TaxID=8364 RepID=Q68EQ4_XENTR|nr:sytl2 protein [Xenopus tropicalis]|eukprot:NP_001007879.1 synaptotagmin-like protein 2 [Xenopus tropicalis]